MNGCHVTNSWRTSVNKVDNVRFKFQHIYDDQQNIVGEELLFNSQSRDIGELLRHQPLFFSLPEFIDALIHTAGFRARYIDNKKLFINIEPHSLCDQLTLSKMIFLHHYLAEKQCHLVVEITERVLCGSCKRLHDGLLLLKENDIILAADDYDIYRTEDEDFIFEHRLFDIFKIVCPRNSHQVIQLENAIRHRDWFQQKHLVVENIETEQDANLVRERISVSGNTYYQAFYFHQPENL